MVSADGDDDNSTISSTPAWRAEWRKIDPGAKGTVSFALLPDLLEHLGVESTEEDIEALASRIQKFQASRLLLQGFLKWWSPAEAHTDALTGERELRQARETIRELRSTGVVDEEAREAKVDLDEAVEEAREAKVALAESKFREAETAQRLEDAESRWTEERTKTAQRLEEFESKWTEEKTRKSEAAYERLVDLGLTSEEDDDDDFLASSHARLAEELKRSKEAARELESQLKEAGNSAELEAKVEAANERAFEAESALAEAKDAANDEKEAARELETALKALSAAKDDVEEERKRLAAEVWTLRDVAAQTASKQREDAEAGVGDRFTEMSDQLYWRGVNNAMTKAAHLKATKAPTVIQRQWRGFTQRNRGAAAPPVTVLLNDDDSSEDEGDVVVAVTTAAVSDDEDAPAVSDEEDEEEPRAIPTLAEPVDEEQSDEASFEDDETLTITTPKPDEERRADEQSDDDELASEDFGDGDDLGDVAELVEEVVEEQEVEPVKPFVRPPILRRGSELSQMIEEIERTSPKSEDATPAHVEEGTAAADALLDELASTLEEEDDLYEDFELPEEEYSLVEKVEEPSLLEAPEWDHLESASDIDPYLPPRIDTKPALSKKNGARGNEARRVSTLSKETRLTPREVRHFSWDEPASVVGETANEPLTFDVPVPSFGRQKWTPPMPPAMQEAKPAPVPTLDFDAAGNYDDDADFEDDDGGLYDFDDDDDVEDLLATTQTIKAAPLRADITLDSPDEDSFSDGD